MTIDITLRAADVAAAARNRNGLTYKGFGVLSGNATSSLLMDYKAEHPDAYRRLIDTLFGGDHPMMTTVKVEMGNDRNNSTGPNAAVMRSRDEYPAVAREPGFQLAADARRVQPGVRLSILRWHAPTWVRGDDDVYRWYKNTILAVYRRYGVMVDSVNPDVNERTADLEWVAQFAHRIRTDETGFEGAGPDDPHAGFRDATERDLFRRIKVITSDEESVGTFGGEVIGDPRYLAAMDVAAYHYSTEDDAAGSFTRLADEFDKEVWNSEAQAVFSNSADRPNAGTGVGGIGGPLEMANTLIKGFVRSRRTHAIYQPAIGACHEHMEYAAKELVSARDPWSGWMYFDAGCAALEHFSRFAELGWAPERADGGADRIWRAIPQASVCEVGGSNPVCGARNGEPSCLTLAAPDGSAFSSVIVNDSPLRREYRIIVDATLPAAGDPLTIWRTAAADAGQPYDAAWRRPVAIVEATSSDDTAADDCDTDGDSATAPDTAVAYTVTLDPWTMITATTLDSAERLPDGTLRAKPAYAYTIPHTPENARPILDIDPAGGILYADDFTCTTMPPVDGYGADGDTREPYVEARGGATGATARYMTDTNGAFEIVADPDRGHVLRQQIDWTHAGNAWIEGDPRTAIGDMRWCDYRVSVDVRFADYDGRAPYALLGAREMGGCRATESACAADLKIRADGVWLLRSYGDEVRRGHLEDLRRRAADHGARPFDTTPGAWNTLTLEVAGDTVRAFVNGAPIATWTHPGLHTAGRVNLGTSFDQVDFANLRVERVDGRSPYYTRLIDDMHMTSWDDGSPILRYEGAWTHEHGQGMFTYMRTISRAAGAGAAVSLDVDGTGVDLFGPSDGSAALDVTVDGRTVMTGAPVHATNGSLRCQFRLEGLERGWHTVTFRTANDAGLALDALGVRA